MVNDNKDVSRIGALGAEMVSERSFVRREATDSCYPAARYIATFNSNLTARLNTKLQ